MVFWRFACRSIFTFELILNLWQIIIYKLTVNASKIISLYFYKWPWCGLTASFHVTFSSMLWTIILSSSLKLIFIQTNRGRYPKNIMTKARLPACSLQLNVKYLINYHYINKPHRCVLASIEVDREFEPMSFKPKTIKWIVSPSPAQHTTLRSKSKDWLGCNRDNVSE